MIYIYIYIYTTYIYIYMCAEHVPCDFVSLSDTASGADLIGGQKEKGPCEQQLDMGHDPSSERGVPRM